MNYEQKYKEALEGIQEILGSGQDSIKMSRLQLRLQGIFPELKESEDEKIRKALIKYCKLQQKANNIGLCGISLIDIIAWLEKPGNPNPYSGISFKHNGHTWGMCARDCGVDLMYDGELRASFNEDCDVF